MIEVSQITVSKDGMPALYRALTIIKELCDGQVPALMTSYTAKIERSKDSDPHTCIYVGFMPMVKIGGVSRPIIRFVSTNEIKFYDYDWHEITEEEIKDLDGDIWTREYDLTNPTFHQVECLVSDIQSWTEKGGQMYVKELVKAKPPKGDEVYEAFQNFAKGSRYQ